MTKAKKCILCKSNLNYHAKGLCKKCYYEKHNKKYYINNKEKISLMCKRYRENNKEKIRAIQRILSKRYKDKHKDRVREYSKGYNKKYYINNKKKLIKQSKIYRIKNKQKISKKNKEKYLQNKDLFLERKRKYYENNKDKILLKNKFPEKKYKISKRNKERRETDKEFNIRHRLRDSLWKALKKYTKTGKIMRSELYEINYNTIIEHLKPFPENLKDYHIDHIKPLCSFNFIDLNNNINLEEVKEAFNPKNLQWMLKVENIKKGGKWQTQK